MKGGIPIQTRDFYQHFVSSYFFKKSLIVYFQKYDLFLSYCMSHSCYHPVKDN